MGGFGVMVEYELELVSQHPALRAQTPLSIFPKPRTTSNTFKHCFMLQIQTVAEIFEANLEHIKEKGGRGPISSVPARAGRWANDPLLREDFETEHNEQCHGHIFGFKSRGYSNSGQK